jgi:hypothetical protein
MDRILDIGVRVRLERIWDRQGLSVFEAEAGQINEGRRERPPRLVEVRTAGDRARKVKDVSVYAAVNKLVCRLVAQHRVFSRPWSMESGSIDGIRALA